MLGAGPIISRLRGAFQKDLPLRLLFEKPGVRDIAAGSAMCFSCLRWSIVAPFPAYVAGQTKVRAMAGLAGTMAMAMRFSAAACDWS